MHSEDLNKYFHFEERFENIFKLKVRLSGQEEPLVCNMELPGLLRTCPWKGSEHLLCSTQFDAVFAETDMDLS